MFLGVQKESRIQVGCPTYGRDCSSQATSGFFRHFRHFRRFRMLSDASDASDVAIAALNQPLHNPLANSGNYFLLDLPSHLTSSILPQYFSQCLFSLVPCSGIHNIVCYVLHICDHGWNHPANYQRWTKISRYQN